METLEAFLKRVEDRYLTMTDKQCEIGDSLFGVVEEGYDALDHSHRWKRGPNGLYSVGEQTFSGEERDSLLEVCPKTQKTYLVMIFAAMLACSERLTEAFRRAMETGELVDITAIVEGCPSAFTSNASGLYCLIDPEGRFYIGLTMCMCFRMAHHALEIDGQVGAAKLVYPFKPGVWRAAVILEAGDVSATEWAVRESIVNVCTGAVGRHEKGLNSWAWDTRFLQHVRLPASKIIESLDALHAHVAAGGKIPGKPSVTRSRGPEWRREWQDIIKAAGFDFRSSPSLFFSVAYATARVDIAKAYLYARPFPRSAYVGSGPQPIQAKRVKSK